MAVGTKRTRCNVLRIARGSVFEIVPIIQVLVEKSVNRRNLWECYEELQVMAKMLTSLIRSVEARVSS